ncbi:hypothetical protein KC332_g16639 [Hortaea werneckii]|nr:hypothetical protein KC335_g15158 [Hortaea werneckii]KAI7382278.1 hypothetical protein KC332_g16639 [Hortaea werneckii]KAI7426665.1 hypothetical protein KC368_g18291 [Hortaea werneckii]KAI7440076.1 hypothetical protein KC336_g2552 [Hortaea werneckii]
MEEQDYLEPNFDPSTLTIPRLRSILVAHNINYPSSAKKGQLVDLFSEHVLPQARKLRNANARVKRTSRGIEDVASAQGPVDEEEEVEVRRPPSSVSRKSSTRRSTRARTEEAEDAPPTARSTRYSTAPPEHTPRRSIGKSGVVRKNEEVEEKEDGGHVAKRPASRASRVSAVTPRARTTGRDEDESPFSNDNVFQSGGSPPPTRSRDTERRRTTMLASRDAERRRSRDARRRTEGVTPMREQTDGAVVPTRKTFDMPVSQSREQELQPTEEFTPDEEQDLVHAEQSGELAPTRRRPRHPASHAAKTAPWAISLAMLVGLGTFYRQEKLEVGYCGVGRPPTDTITLPNHNQVQLPEWLEPALPRCEPCPPHAFCGELLETTCEPGFVLTQHPLSCGGLVPLPPSCEPDSAKARKVSAVKERAVEELRQQNAKYECGEASKAEVRESALKDTISTRRRKGMSNEEFEDLWASALGEIQNVEEVVSGTDGSGGEFTLRSHSLASIPLTCAVRRHLQETLRQYLWQLVTLLTILSSAAYGRHRFIGGREEEKQAKALAAQALEKLSQQAALHAYDPAGYRENYISVAQLRDDVLREEFSASRRKKVWERVQRKVEGNSNVRPMVREGRSGDVGRVWEWVGAVGMIESPPGTGDRRKSGRVSFGGASERLLEPRDEGDVSAVQKWEDGGKPYY